MIMMMVSLMVLTELAGIPLAYIGASGMHVRVSLADHLVLGQAGDGFSGVTRQATHIIGDHSEEILAFCHNRSAGSAMINVETARKGLRQSF